MRGLLNSLLICLIPVVMSLISPAISASRETDIQTIEAALEKLNTQKETWTFKDAATRCKILAEITENLKAKAEEWVQLSCSAKGIELGSSQETEEWLAGPFVFARNLRLLRESLEKFYAIGDDFFFPLPGIEKKTCLAIHEERLWAQVFPDGKTEATFYDGFEAWIKFNPDVSTEGSFKKALYQKHQARYYHVNASSGKICLVLGAGNVSSITPMDVLYKMFVTSQAVILKMSPVNDYLGETLEAIFEPLITQGFMQVVYGGVEQGRYLCKHEAVETIHITGSHETHNKIVFDDANPTASSEPVNKKTITSELGNVSPVIIVPGNWTDKDISFHAKNVASMLTNNAGFNCNTVRVIVTSADWPRREEFLAAIEELLDNTPYRKAYYPGALNRFKEFLLAHADPKYSDLPEDGTLPWRLIKDLDPDAENEICFQKEAFCSVCAETKIEDKITANEFLKAAVEFCNEKLWGTLCATIIIDDQCKEKIKDDLQKAIDTLRYGTVSINHWPGVAYGLVRTPWGGYPENKPEDIQSGSGFVHNTYMMTDIQKVMMSGPFRKPFLSPEPIWFMNNPIGLKMAKTLFDYETSSSISSFAWNAFQATKTAAASQCILL